MGRSRDSDASKDDGPRAVVPATRPQPKDHEVNINPTPMLPGSVPVDTNPCDAVRDRIRAGEALDAALQHHAEACVGCSSLVQLGLGVQLGFGAGLGAAAGVAWAGRSTAMLDALEREQGWRSRLRERPTPVRWIIAGLIAAVVPLLWLVGSPRPDLGVYPGARMAVDLLGLWVPLAVLLPLSMWPLHRRVLPPWVAPAVVLLAVVTMLGLALLPVAHWDHPASRLGIGDDRIRRAIGCLVTGVVSGLPILVGGWLLSRDGGALWRRGAPGAVLAALAGGLAVYFHCPLTSPSHLVLGHATIALPFVVLGIVGSRRALQS